MGSSECGSCMAPFAQSLTALRSAEGSHRHTKPHPVTHTALNAAQRSANAPRRTATKLHTTDHTKHPTQPHTNLPLSPHHPTQLLSPLSALSSSPSPSPTTEQPLLGDGLMLSRQTPSYRSVQSGSAPRLGSPTLNSEKAVTNWGAGGWDLACRCRSSIQR